MSDPAAASAAFGRLVEIMARLHGPGGCPWDREQTHATLRPYLIEETYEVLEAIESGDPAALRDELGDRLPDSRGRSGDDDDLVVHGDSVGERSRRAHRRHRHG